MHKRPLTPFHFIRRRSRTSSQVENGCSPLAAFLKAFLAFFVSFGADCAATLRLTTNPAIFIMVVPPTPARSYVALCATQ
jgi:hypothetical protein